MEKMSFMTKFLIMILVLSYSQQSDEEPLNQPNETLRESILLGCDNYTPIIPNEYHNYNINFSIYFLLKNWNDTYIKFNKNDSFLINSLINVTNEGSHEVKFNRTFYNSSKIYYDINSDRFDLAKYECQSIKNITEGIPMHINFIDDFSNGIKINNSEKNSVSSSFVVFKKELLNLRNKTIFNINGTNIPQILRNATYVSKSPTSFKIREDASYICYYRDIFERAGLNNIESNNIQLLTSSYGYPKKIPCVG